MVEYRLKYKAHLQDLDFDTHADASVEYWKMVDKFCPEVGANFSVVMVETTEIEPEERVK